MTRNEGGAAAAAMTLPFLFATGIENSSPTIEAGRTRRDQMAACGHYDRFREDFALAASLRVNALRYGVPLHRTWPGPDRYDWSFADAALAELRRLGLEPVVDLCHFGVPDWIGNFQNPDFPELFREYAGAFARRYPWIRLYTPVNEMYVCARNSAMWGLWNEELKSHPAYLTALKHLVRANVLAMHAILEARPDALFIQSESSEYFHAAVPEAGPIVARRNAHRFLSLDLNYGRPLDRETRGYVLENGMLEADLRFFETSAVPRAHCILGSDFYCSNEHHVQADGSMHGDGEVLGFAVVVREYAARYGLPLMHTETNLDQGAGGLEAADWLERQWLLLRSLMHSGVHVTGFTWYSLTDQVDWDTMLAERAHRVNPRGLFDLERRIRPVGEAYRRLIAAWRGRETA